MTKGFIVYALGHTNYYQMAETMAASILFNNKDAKVSVICDDPDKIEQKQLFDQVILMPKEKFIVDGKIVFNKATILMYDFSPYDVTIKLDADLIWLNGRDPLKLFEDLKELDLALMNRGHGWGKGNSVWTTEEELRDAYGFTDQDKLYKIYGEFVYFKKGEIAKKFFKTSKAIFNKPKVSCNEFSNGTFTDELAFQIAIMQTGIDLPENYTPVFNIFLGLNNFLYSYAYQLPDNFYAYSIGGNKIPSFTKEQYNILANHYYSQMGLENPYQVRDKKSFLPERIKM
jgi:hypothetical protein